MDARELKGCQIAATSRIKKNRLGWQVPSQSGSGSYTVTLDGEPFCTCPDFEARHQRCKHIYAVEFTIRRETTPDGTVTETRSVRVTYGQNWAAYNAAQVEEKDRFLELLSALCAGIEQPPQMGRGRPRLPLRDVVTAAAVKVYSLRSGRRASSDVRDAHGRKLLGRVPHYNSVFNYLENPALTPILKGLVEQSAGPLRAIESDFAVDSSGFSTSVYARWFDAKYGGERREHVWLKAHLMVGVKTNVVTSVEVTAGDANDSPLLPTLVQRTGERFRMVEVSADKGYTSHRNLEAIEAAGAVPYVPFKVNTTGEGPETWRRLWHFFNLNRGEFLAHYHKRSNVESTFSMVKAKFGGAVRAKTFVAQVNEVLLKVLCHNLCVLIQSMREFGIDPTFRANEAVA